jgi:putative Ca2+/H+ antiporter (TMEM165/GDT1 family)
MDWSLFVSTFGAVFLAELGDKTQIATLSLSAGTRAPWTIFLASALALACTSALAVLGAGAVGRLISPLWLARVAGAALILMGVWTLWSAGRAD